MVAGLAADMEQIGRDTDGMLRELASGLAGGQVDGGAGMNAEWLD